MKIGQEVKVEEDFKINTIVSDKVMTVKVGDKGFLDSNGLMHLTTGSGRGKIVKLNGVEIKGYDHANIAKKIYGRLNAVFGLECYMDEEEIELKGFLEEIEDVLMDIL